MAIRVVHEMDGQVLQYDTDDVEDFQVSTPRDVRDVTPPGAEAREFEPGQARLLLCVVFKPGKSATWVESKNKKGGKADG